MERFTISAETKAALNAAGADPGSVYAMKVKGDGFLPHAGDGDFAIVAAGMEVRADDFVLIAPKQAPSNRQIHQAALALMTGWRTIAPESEVVPALCIRKYGDPDRVQWISVDRLAFVDRVVAWQPASVDQLGEAGA
jgi:hypothetical protein